jgi:hypothetical protein
MIGPFRNQESCRQWTSMDRQGPEFQENVHWRHYPLRREYELLRHQIDLRQILHISTVATFRETIGQYSNPMERDFESQVGKVCGKVTVLKANHHGYYDTCNPFFLRDLSPQVIIFDARSNNHPVPTTMARIVDHQVWGGDRDYYITVDAPRKKLGEDLWSKFKPWGHIVVRVYPGGNKYQVFVLDADSQRLSHHL